MWWSASRPATHEPTNDPDDPDAENGKMPLWRPNTICGLRKKVFFFIILGGILITVAAIAVGIGAGISLSKSPSYVTALPSVASFPGPTARDRNANEHPENPRKGS